MTARMYTTHIYAYLHIYIISDKNEQNRIDTSISYKFFKINFFSLK